MELIEKLLEACELQQYFSVLQDNDIDDSIILELNNDDLKELGLSLGHRKQLLKAIENHLSSQDEVALANESITKATPAPTAGASSHGTADAEWLHLTIVFCDLVGLP